jgi:hypothetical protein
MFKLTFRQKGHFPILAKISTRLLWPNPLVKVHILFINVNVLIKLNFKFKSCVFL